MAAGMMKRQRDAIFMGDTGADRYAMAQIPAKKCFMGPRGC